MGQGWHWMQPLCHSQRWVRLGAASGRNIPERCWAEITSWQHPCLLEPATVPRYLLGTVAEWAVTAPMGASSSQHKTWIPHERPLLRVPPTSKGARLSGLASCPAPLLSAPLLHSPARRWRARRQREGDPSDGCGRERGWLPREAGRSARAAPGAVLIPAAQALPPVPIHCRCAAAQGAREAGSPLHSLPTLLGAAPLPCPPAAGSSGVCPHQRPLPCIVQRCHELLSPQVFCAIMQSRSNPPQPQALCSPLPTG